jgi:mannose-6-phosphate isomerase-like protein (cupin superfamily)
MSLRHGFIKKVTKLWGMEFWIANNDLYCGKLLTLNSGFQSSLHYHKKKTETFYVVSGEMKLEYVDDNGEITSEIIRSGGIVDIPPMLAHRFSVPAQYDGSMATFCNFIEISTHHDDDDSYRIEESKRIGG